MDPITICLVACGKAKLDHAAPAKDLYNGSLFTAARRYAEGCDEWRIVSGRHGLVDPDAVLEPYDFKLAEKDATFWGIGVADRLLVAFRGCGPLSIVILAGETYAHPIMYGLREFRGGSPAWRENVVDVRAPLRGMGLGKRLAWFAEEARKDAAALSDPALAFGGAR